MNNGQPDETEDGKKLTQQELQLRSLQELDDKGLLGADPEEEDSPVAKEEDA